MSRPDALPVPSPEDDAGLNVKFRYAFASIIVPTHNRQRLLMETLESIRAQTEADWEVIVVDDGSTDDTERAVAELMSQEGRIRYFKRAGEQRGASACRNFGFSLARGEYVMFLDSDDCLAPWCLSQRIDAMRRHPDLDFAVFPTRLFNREWYDLPLMWNRLSGEEDDLDRLLRIDPPWGTEGAIWRKSALDRLAGPWDPAVASWQDIEFHVRALAAGLKYRKFESFDTFHRMGVNERQTITASASTLGHMRSRFDMFGRIYRLLEREGLLTERRRAIVTGLYFNHAETALREVSQQEAVHFWKVCPWRGLMSRSAYTAVLFYFRWAHLPRLRWRLRRLFTLRWNWLDLAGRSKTQFQTPTDELPQHKAEASA